MLALVGNLFDFAVEFLLINEKLEGRLHHVGQLFGARCQSE